MSPRRAHSGPLQIPPTRETKRSGRGGTQPPAQPPCAPAPAAPPAGPPRPGLAPRGFSRVLSPACRRPRQLLYLLNLAAAGY